jgi:CBS domain-containing protein
VDEIATRFTELGIHHVPVVDAERRVIGIVSETDLLRARQSRRAVLIGNGLSDTDDAPLVFARDVMARQVVSIPLTADFSDALALQLDRQIHALPVIEEERLIGMICSRDFLREFSYGELDCSRNPISTLLKGPGPASLAPETTLDDALLAMHETGFACLAVAQGDCPLGVVSLRDIVREKCRVDERAEYLQEMPSETTVVRVLRNSPPIRSGQRLCEAAAAMVEHALPAVTIVNQSNRLLGLVTEDDVLKVMYDALA